jgi:hypothetical protein
MSPVHGHAACCMPPRSGESKSSEHWQVTCPAYYGCSLSRLGQLGAALRGLCKPTRFQGTRTHDETSNPDDTQK